MKKIVLTCGLISGTIVTTMMVITAMTCYENPNFEGNMWLGYASMLLAFSMIFVGIKNYRDKHNGGIITIGKAFMIGLYITLVAGTMYVLVWLIQYYLFIPDFMDKYSDHMIRAAQKEGLSGAAMQSKMEEVKMYKSVYSSPVGVILMTYAEILPVGLLVSLLSALILKRRTNPTVTPV